MGKTRNSHLFQELSQNQSDIQSDVQYQPIQKRFRRKTGKIKRKKMTKIIHNVCFITKLSNDKIIKKIQQKIIQIYDVEAPNEQNIKKSCDQFEKNAIVQTQQSIRNQNSNKMMPYSPFFSIGDCILQMNRGTPVYFYS